MLAGQPMGVSAMVSDQLAPRHRIPSIGRALDLEARLAGARQSTVQTPDRNATSAGPARARRILLADDHHINHLTIQAMLEDRDIEVVVAFDGAEAVRKFKADDFDCVLMDIDMPLMDGISAVRAIRAFESEHHARRTPIAMFTAMSGPDVEEAARQAGADTYLTKPITVNQLYAFVDPAIQARGGVTVL